MEHLPCLVTRTCSMSSEHFLCPMEHVMWHMFWDEASSNNRTLSGRRYVEVSVAVPPHLRPISTLCLGTVWTYPTWYARFALEQTNTNDTRFSLQRKSMCLGDIWKTPWDIFWHMNGKRSIVENWKRDQISCHSKERGARSNILSEHRAWSATEIFLLCW